MERGELGTLIAVLSPFLIDAFHLNCYSSAFASLDVLARLLICFCLQTTVQPLQHFVAGVQDPTLSLQRTDSLLLC